MTFEISTASRDEVATLIDWAAAEGWNPGLADLDAFRAQDADGFLVGRLDGAPIAGVSVVRYRPGFGFLGFYLCAPAWRGRGYGWRVWQAGMARLEDCVVGLDGVVAQQDNYRKFGFALAHVNHRFQGRVDLPPQRDAAIRRVVAADVEALIAYDARHFGPARPEFLRGWVDASSGRIASILVENGAIAGFGVIRPCRAGWKIGPLFADDARGADRLFRALACEARGEVTLDPPAPNAAALALCRRYGLSPVFETARMYRGAAPELPLSNIYGVTTFELG